MPTRVVFLVYPNVTQLDLTGPAQVLSRLPDAKVDVVWKSIEPIQTDSGFAIRRPRRWKRLAQLTFSAFQVASAASK